MNTTHFDQDDLLDITMTTAAIATHFTTDHRFRQFFADHAPRLGGSVGVWSMLANVAIAAFENNRSRDEEDWMDSIAITVEAIYRNPQTTDWNALLAPLLESEDDRIDAIEADAHTEMLIDRMDASGHPGSDASTPS